MEEVLVHAVFAALSISDLSEADKPLFSVPSE